MERHKTVELRLPHDTKGLIIASMHGNSKGLEMRQTLVETDQLKDGRIITVNIKDKEQNNEQ